MTAKELFTLSVILLLHFGLKAQQHIFNLSDSVFVLDGKPFQMKHL
ncbi:hypothetical protein [Mucilaginibacter boryungensis]|uniref:Uncharacterized protein n=1 Tax=Mucilaginibacter boryungensis TaxID=768480 RepID=A0ABR9XF83_9SPHI|nr:hypothetical protein [Mucilaginibacter boryungensis]MBE9665825.1 hypothetical protein [Mucilaginibacter boryungensis]